MAALPDDPARTAPPNTLPGDTPDWTGKQQRAYESRIEALEQEHFIDARNCIQKVLLGEMDEVDLLVSVGIRRCNLSDLIDLLDEQVYDTEQRALLWLPPSDKADQIKKAAIDNLAWDVAKAKAELETV